MRKLARRTSPAPKLHRQTLPAPPYSLLLENLNTIGPSYAHWPDPPDSREQTAAEPMHAHRLPSTHEREFHKLPSAITENAKYVKNNKKILLRNSKSHTDCQSDEREIRKLTSTIPGVQHYLETKNKTKADRGIPLTDREPVNLPIIRYNQMTNHKK